MQLSCYDYPGLKQYILYTRENGVVKLHYVFKLFLKENYTELTYYNYGNYDKSIRIDGLFAFDKTNPLKSINNFNKILILK